ncbi:ATP-binding protein [Geobacter argillaceus]|uniref:histidine kinase n=1 Tax=Geobacter argillaceus TaxID=345631 RepID=A0A562WUQ8_9BACT|nr:ATP-binding protein [Geobacter argillaceus]TWJ33399.1 PAS domain S-box-containing protein [Geobacter argillaceus]
MTEQSAKAKSGLVPRYRTAVAITFVVTLLASLGAIWLHMHIIRRDNQEEALALAGYQASVLNQYLDGALSATYALAVVLRENGYYVNPPAFERLATDLLRFHPGASSLQYAPGGVVRHIVPLAGNERAIGHDLLADTKRNRKAREAVETRQLTLDGPLNLVQGGVGLAGRLPVFRVDRITGDDFWGFANVLIRLTDLLKAAEIRRLEKQGYDYVLWRLHPDTSKPQIIARSGPDRLNDAISYDFAVYSGTWHLSLQPRDGWLARRHGVLWLEVGIALFLSLLVSRLAYLLLKQPILLQQEVELRTRELRESEEALRRHQEQLEDLVRERTSEVARTVSLLNAAIESTVDGILVVGLDRKVSIYNRKFVNLLDVPEELLTQATTRGLLEFMSSRVDGIEGYIQRIDELYRDPVRMERDLFRTRDGKVFECYSIPQLLEGKPIGRVWSIRDVTEEKLAEKALQEKDELLEENNLELEAINDELETTIGQLGTANRELESFTYAVSHDLRAPLRHVGGFARILIEESAERLDETGREYLDRIVRGCNRMQEMIDSLLALSRINQSELVFKEVDLSETARGIADELREGQPGRRVEFTVAEGVTVMGDPSLLKGLLENLLENAWKYSSKQDVARIEFGSSAESGETIYFVRDNGAGLDMTYANRLFVPFQRLHRDEEFPGTGVGLATVQRIVHRHGGRIWVEAAPGRGATFSFTLAGWRHDSHEGDRQKSH